MRKGGGWMNTTENREFDYQAYMRENPPDPSRIRRGTEARRQRLEAARKKIAFTSRLWSLPGKSEIVGGKRFCFVTWAIAMPPSGSQPVPLNFMSRLWSFIGKSDIVRGKRLILAAWAIVIPPSGSRPVPLNTMNSHWRLNVKSDI